MKTMDAQVREYIDSFEGDAKRRLLEIREIVLEQAPEAEEAFAYGMPAFRLNGPLVYFGAFAKHIGFYPTASGIEAFREELSRYKGAKGSVQFPLDEPLPAELIRKIVRFRADENLARKKPRPNR